MLHAPRPRLSAFLSASSAAAALSACTLPATAQVSAFDITSTAGQLSDGTNVVANVLSLDFTGQYTGSLMLVELTQGAIINVTAFGADSNFAPHEGLVGIEPDLAFDTFLAQGGTRAQDNIGGDPQMGGGAVTIDPTEVAAVWNDPVKISQAWNPGAGNVIADMTDFAVAQLAFTDDAVGRITYKAGANGSLFITQTSQFGGAEVYQILNGRVVTTLPGDYDSNGHVGQGDLDFILQNWGRDIASEGVPDGWVQGLPTGVVSQDELDPILSNWGANIEGDLYALGPNAAALPEPASLALTAAFGLALTTLRRRAR